PRRKERRYLYSDYPLRRSTGALCKIVCADLKAQPFRSHLERIAHVRAYRNRPSVGRVRGPVEGHRRIGVDIRSAFEVVADLRLNVGLVDTPARSIPSERHQLIREHTVEPGAFGIN